MFRRQITGIFYLVGLWICISVLTWPAFVFCSTVIANLQGEAWQLDAWNQLPRALIVERFLDDYLKSWPVAIPIGLIAVIDYLLLARYKSTWLVGGILLPLAGATIAYTLYQEPMSVLPVLVATGAMLAIVHRLIDFVAGSANREALL